MEGFLFQASVYLAAAVIAVPIAARLGLGSVLGYLAAGILIGPVLGLVGSETKDVQHFAEFGVVMMLFIIGLEMEPKRLYRMKLGPALPGEPTDPTVLRDLRRAGDQLPIDDYRIPFGKAALRHAGDDITLVSWGWAAWQSVAAAQRASTITLGASADAQLVPPGPIKADGSRIQLTVVVIDSTGSLASEARFRGSHRCARPRSRTRGGLR